MKVDKLLKVKWLKTFLSLLFILVMVFDAKIITANNSEPVVLQLAWKHQFQFAGYYAALANGYYEEAGLDVTITEGGGGRFAREELLSNRAQYGVAGSELLLHRLDGDPFVVLAPVFQHSPSILVTRENSQISNIQDLIGKRIMLLPGKKDALILAALSNEGVKPGTFQRVDQSYNLNDLIKGRIDAVSGYITNEPWLLKQEGVVPKIILPMTYGVDFYGDCLFTTDHEINDHPERAGKFLEASLKGWEYAMAHPDDVIDILLGNYGLKKTREHLRYEADAMKKIIMPDLVQIGTVNPGRWQHIAETYAKLEMISSDFSLEGFLYKGRSESDNLWAIWTVGVTISISILIGIITITLFVFNRKLKIEVEKHKKTEETLIESEKKYRHLYNNAPTGLYEIDFLKERFLYVNEIMCKYLGYSEEEFLEMNPVDLLTEESKVVFMKRFEKYFYGESVIDDVEFNIIKKNGQLLCVLLKSDFIYENGKLRGARVVVHDITQRKRAEEDKINAQKVVGEQKKLALVGQIAGKMAHDFNNILGIIMGNSELLLMDCKNKKDRKILELIFKQTIRGKNLTKNLVAFAKDQEPKHEFFSINETMDLVINLLRKDLDGIELVKEKGKYLPSLLADPGMIEHALVNLIQNSIHATSMVEQRRIIARTYSKDECIYFEIEDNGCGIPEKYFEQIYEPSFTLKGRKDMAGFYEKSIKGTGYGMANVKKYIEQHRGSISFESAEGSGTKFIIRLPVIKKELTSKEKKEISEELAHIEKTILIVEDETAISDVQNRVLTQKPCLHKVDIANSGQAAIDLFNKNDYELISLDYMLPGNISGMNVYRHIREVDETIPILFISGNIEFLESIKELKQEDDRIDHISKPCPNTEYVKSINLLLERSGSLDFVQKSAV